MSNFQVSEITATRATDGATQKTVPSMVEPRAVAEAGSAPAGVSSAKISKESTLSRWWTDYREEIVRGVQTAFTWTEKALDGIPVPEAKFAFWAAAEALKTLQVSRVIYYISHTYDHLVR